MTVSLNVLVEKFPLHGAVVLVVDDTPANILHLRRLLSSAGAEVIAAEHVEDARQLLALRRPHVILLDVMLPDIDGFTFCRELKSQSMYADIPILFISSLIETTDIITAFSVGASDYITKPFIPAEVMARVFQQYRTVCVTKALHDEKEELQRRNRQLAAARQATCDIFSAFSEQLCGKELDGKYLLHERIGAGGFAVVYRATHNSLGRQVAVKVLRPFEPARRAQRMQRFAQEITAVARVVHPNVVEIIDAQVSSDGIPYLVMELLRGRPLSDDLRPQQPLALSRTLHIALPICAALVEAHRVGVVHRDIKPPNIFLHQASAGEQPKILDFGIAKILEEGGDRPARVTQAGDWSGTIGYIAPEQLLGRVIDGRADVYSLGVTLYEMLTGHLPYDGQADGLWGLLQSAQPAAVPRPSQLNPLLPVELDDLLMATLQVDLEQRPRADRVLQALGAIERQLATTSE